MYDTKYHQSLRETYVLLSRMNDLIVLLEKCSSLSGQAGRKSASAYLLQEEIKQGFALPYADYIPGKALGLFWKLARRESKIHSWLVEKESLRDSGPSASLPGSQVSVMRRLA